MQREYTSLNCWIGKGFVIKLEIIFLLACALQEAVLSVRYDDETKGFRDHQYKELGS